MAHTTEMEALKKLARAIDAMRAVQEDLPLQTFAMFLAIALEEGQTVNRLGERIGIAQSSSSRNVSLLSDWKQARDKNGQHLPGLKLVESRQDPQNFTMKNVYLKKTGKALVDHMVLILTGTGGN